MLQFADVVNRHDFIDTIVQYADPGRFLVGVCVRSDQSNIAAPLYAARTPRWVLGGPARRHIPAAAWRLAGLLRRWRADVLHAHHYDQAVIGWLATLLYPHTRLVIGRHYSDAIYRSSRGLKRRALLAVESLVNRAAARVVAPSRLIEELLTDRQHVPATKVARIPYCFVAEKYSPPDEEAVRVRRELAPDGAFVIGNFARLHEEKGQRFLIEAVVRLRPRLPGLILWVVGEGPERPALERHVREAGLGDAVRLLGWRRDAMSLMGAVDAVVQPTLQEAFSQVMAEALWMGKPLVITDVSGASDVVTDGETGLLVKKTDPGGLAAAVERLAHDPNLRGRLAAAGRAYVEAHLTVDKVIPRYEALYAELARA